MHYVRVVISLSILYLVITANLQLSNLLMALLWSMAITALIRPEKRPFEIRRLPTMLVGLVQYTFVLGRDVFLNGIKVAQIVLTPSLDIKPGIIAIPSLCETDLGTALSAHAITVAPGEMVIEISEDGVMYTHCLNATDKDKYVAEAQRQRREMLEKIFL